MRWADLQRFFGGSSRLFVLMLAGLTVGFMQIQNLLPPINAVGLAPAAATTWGLFTVFVQRRYA